MKLKGVIVQLGAVVALLTLLFFAFFYGVLPFATNKDSIVDVPDLNGMTLEEAIRLLKTNDLKYEVTDSAYNSAKKPLTVLHQFPAAFANVKINRKINLRLNAKIPPSVSYPDLTSSSYDFALEQLGSLELKIGTIEYRPDIADNAILESQIDHEVLANLFPEELELI